MRPIAAIPAAIIPDLTLVENFMLSPGLKISAHQEKMHLRDETKPDENENLNPHSLKTSSLF
jgi:hypothetical protein